jgi:hypothetical protein
MIPDPQPHEAARQELELPTGQEIPLAKGSKISVSNITELASGAITAGEDLIVVLVQPEDPEDMPASDIIHWPSKPTVLAPEAFSSAAEMAVKAFAAAVVKLAHSRRGWYAPVAARWSAGCRRAGRS